jgi:hypothetical protein
VERLCAGRFETSQREIAQIKMHMRCKRSEHRKWQEAPRSDFNARLTATIDWAKRPN